MPFKVKTTTGDSGIDSKQSSKEKERYRQGIKIFIDALDEELEL